jgi:hypothetical protein
VRQSQNFISGVENNIYKFSFINVTGGDPVSLDKSDTKIMKSDTKIIKIAIPKSYQLYTEPPENCYYEKFFIGLNDGTRNLSIRPINISTITDIYNNDPPLRTGEIKKYIEGTLQKTSYPAGFEKFKKIQKNGVDLYVSKDISSVYYVIVFLPYQEQNILPEYAYYSVVYQLDGGVINQDAVDQVINQAIKTKIE